MKRSLTVLAGPALCLPLVLCASTRVQVDSTHVVVTSPAASPSGQFGVSASSLGKGFIVGAPFETVQTAQEGAAYWFDATGGLRRTFLNPETNQNLRFNAFGSCVAELPNGNVVIGATGTGVSDAGVAYLFDTNGQVLAEMPRPGTAGRHGFKAAALGNGMFVVTSDKDHVGVYDATGGLYRVVEAPPGGTLFGYSVAALGDDRFITGARDGAPANAGRAYVHSIDGDLLLTLTNPVAQANGWFGWAVEGLGTNRVLVSAYENNQGTVQGVVYMYDTQGSLLTTITNPAGRFERFGTSIQALDDELFVVGNEELGTAYLFDDTGQLLKVFSGASEGFSLGTDLATVGTNGLVMTGRGSGFTAGRAEFHRLSVSFPDPFEPDDFPREANSFIIGRKESHTLHEPTDRDWIKFFATSQFSYDIKTEVNSNTVDTVIDLFKIEIDGSLTPVDINVNESPLSIAADGGESISMTNPPTGTYYVRVKNADTNNFGSKAKFDLSVKTRQPPLTAVTILAVDLMSPNGSLAPPSATAFVDGASVGGFGAGNALTLNNVPAGLHTIAVTAPTGYFPDEDTWLPGQVHNPTNQLFGNPKQVEVFADQFNFVVFAFFPLTHVSGRLRDAVTGEWVHGARIGFEAQSGVLSGLVITQYPAGAVYAPDWQTGADGWFPTNVLLPATNWALRVNGAAFTSYRLTNAVLNPTPGSQPALGEFGLFPLDSGSNGIADAWESHHFGGSADPSADADRDGRSNREEYFTGTDPTNAGDVLSFSSAMPPGAGLMSLEWPVASGRAYIINRSPGLAPVAWTNIYGPWVAASNGLHRWNDPGSGNRSGDVYRIDVILP